MQLDALHLFLFHLWYYIVDYMQYYTRFDSFKASKLVEILHKNHFTMAGFKTHGPDTI